jgi:hypothetical protein
MGESQVEQISALKSSFGIGFEELVKRASTAIQDKMLILLGC